MMTFICILGLVVLLSAGLRWFLNQIRFKRRGYRCVRKSRDTFEYQEVTDDGVRSMGIDGVMQVGAPHILLLPGAEKWDCQLPIWAKGRRKEIIARIQDELPAPHFAIIDQG
jgi:hypothetical protein